MAEQRPRLIQLASNKLTIEHSVTIGPFDLSNKQIQELEQLVHEYIQTDKTITTLETKRETLKRAILEKFGKNAQHLISLQLRYPRKKRRKISFWFNRNSYDINKLFERLRNHPGIFSKTISEGTAFRIVVPASPASRDLVIARAEKELKKLFPKAEITAYRGGSLDQIVREDELIRLAEKAGVSLAGTRKPVINARVYDD